MAYAYPTNMSDPVDLFQWVDSTVGQSFGWGILVALGVILFVVLSYRYDAKQSFGYTSFVCAVISVLLFFIGLLQVHVMIIFIILAAVGVLWLLSERD